MMNDLSLYVHIPFCARKCRYCDFTSFPAPPGRIGEYMQALRSELADAGDEYGELRLNTIYIGGGTPTYIDTSYIARLCELIFEIMDVSPDAEISIECNPGSTDRNKLEVYRGAGINRLSIGAQSVNDNELALLGRIHDSTDLFRTYEDARDAGFDNINIDLMSAIPGQTLSTYEHSLRTICELGPEHISAYSLQLEEGTYLYEHRDEFEFTDEDTDREMYHMTADVLGEYGYRRYEISNYSGPGYECRHNIVYWTGGDYLGIGLGAASLIDNVRYKNTEELLRYLSGERAIESIPLSADDRKEEFMFLGLRMICGISCEEFKLRFGKDIDEVYGEVIRDMTGRGMLIREGDRIRLSDPGLDVCNYVLSGFML